MRTKTVRLERLDSHRPCKSQPRRMSNNINMPTSKFVSLNSWLAPSRNSRTHVLIVVYLIRLRGNPVLQRLTSNRGSPQSNWNCLYWPIHKKFLGLPINRFWPRLTNIEPYGTDENSYCPKRTVFIPIEKNQTLSASRPTQQNENSDGGKRDGVRGDIQLKWGGRGRGATIFCEPCEHDGSAWSWSPWKS